MWVDYDSSTRQLREFLSIIKFRNIFLLEKQLYISRESVVQRITYNFYHKLNFNKNRYLFILNKLNSFYIYNTLMWEFYSR